MLRKIKVLVLLAAAGALLALPATGFADHKGTPHGGGKGKAKGEAKRCAKTPKVGYVVHGTLVSATADDPATPASEATVTITVTRANRHARNSGELADQDPAQEGVQVAGGTYTVPAGDAFILELEGFEGADTPSPGDAVKVQGKIPRTKKKCAAEGTSLADRYGTPDVRRVTITDADPDV
jgi:hypothetical protein